MTVRLVADIPNRVFWTSPLDVTGCWSPGRSFAFLIAAAVQLVLDGWASAGVIAAVVR